MKNRLKVLRAERDWTQANLADELGVSRQTINAIEKEKFDHLILNTEYCQQIRKQLKRDNRIKRIKQVVLLTIVMSVLIGILYYYS